MSRFIEIGDGLIVSTDSVQSVYTTCSEPSPSLKMTVFLKDGSRYIYTYENKDVLIEEYERVLKDLKVKNRSCYLLKWFKAKVRSDTK